MGRGLVVFSLAVLGFAGCSGGSTIEPDPLVERFVGTWDATEYTLTPDGNPSFFIDVLSEFGPFHISIEPSGQYTAAIEATGVCPELGQLTVIGSTVRLDPATSACTTSPCVEPATANFSFVGADRLTLQGPTDIDINGDEICEPFFSRIELSRR